MDACTLVCRELREIAREIALLNQEVQLLRDTLIGLATDRKTEPPGDILIPPHHTGISPSIKPIKQTEREGE